MAAMPDDLGEVGPWGDRSLAASLDDAGQVGEGKGALRGAGPVADVPGDDPMAQGAFGLLVGQRQPVVG